MDNKLLSSFIAVIEHASFSKASESLFLSQSTISTHIKNLENNLNIQLVLRSNKEIMPTKAGVVFYKYAKNIIDLEKQAVHSIDSLNSQTEGEIEIISSAIPAQFFLNKKIAEFRNTFTNTIFKVKQKNSYDIIKRLHTHWYDFAIIGTKYESEDFNLNSIYKDQFVLAIPKGYPLPKSNSIEEISKYILQQPIIFRSSSSATQRETESLILKLNLSSSNLNIVAYFNDPQSVINAVYNGIGIAFTSSLSTEIYEKAQAINVIKIPRHIYSREFYILSRKNYVLPPKQQLFFEFISKNM